MNNSSRRRWAGELEIFVEDQETVFRTQRSVGDELFALSQNGGITVGGRALLQDSSRALEHDESVCCALASRLGSLDAAEENAAWLRLRRPLSNWGKNVRSEYGKELPNTSQKHFHVLTVWLGKLRAPSRSQSWGCPFLAVSSRAMPAAYRSPAGRPAHLPRRSGQSLAAQPSPRPSPIQCEREESRTRPNERTRQVLPSA